MSRWLYGQGARQNITEQGRIIELRVRIIGTLVLCACVQIFTLVVLTILSLLEAAFFQTLIENVRCVISCLLVPLLVGFPVLFYVTLRDLFDPNFEPLNKTIERTKPLWPWVDAVGRMREWIRKRWF